MILLKRERSIVASDDSSWMNTYADMTTLLLTFFILLFSFSSINVEKWESATETKKEEKIEEEQVLKEVKIEQPTDFDALYRSLVNYIKANKMENEISAYRGSNYVFLRFKSNIFFNPDSSILRTEAKNILEKLCEAIKGISKEIKSLEVMGHTADVVTNEKYPISDRELSTERANSVVSFIEGKNVIEPYKLLSIGYGKYLPIGDNSTIEGQAQNRRVEIYISELDTKLEAVRNLYKEIKESEEKPKEVESNESYELASEDVENLFKA